MRDSVDSLLKSPQMLTDDLSLLTMGTIGAAQFEVHMGSRVPSCIHHFLKCLFDLVPHCVQNSSGLTLGFAMTDLHASNGLDTFLVVIACTVIKILTDISNGGTN